MLQVYTVTVNDFTDIGFISGFIGFIIGFINGYTVVMANLSNILYFYVYGFVTQLYIC